MTKWPDAKSLFGAVRVLVPGVGGSMLVSLALLAASRQLLPQATLARSNAEVGNYLQTVGTIYAVLLAFVVFVVWTQFTETRQDLEQEANELFDIVRMSNGFAEPIATRIRDIVQRYVSLLLDVEWQALAKDEADPLDAGWRLIDELWDVLRGYEPDNERCRMLYAEVLTRFNALADARTARISSGRTRIPIPVRILLYAGAVTIVSSLCLFGVEDFWIHAYIMASLAGAVAHVLVVVEDLDDPFDGYWQAPRGPFERLLVYLEVVSAPAGA